MTIEEYREIRKQKHEGHTPGPWVVASNHVIPRVDGPPDGLIGPNTVCEVFNNDNANANACLIADAPQLLAQRDALLSLVDELARAVMGDCGTDKYNALIEVAEAIVAEGTDES